ncbi:hypothetical protein [Pseudomonas putida]
MTEVHRYKVVKMLSEGGNRISYAPHGPEVVMAEALDAALAQNAELRTSLEAVTLNLNKTDKVVLALQQRLNEADQRIDEAKQLLREFVDWYQATEDDSSGLLRLIRRADAICQLTKDSPEVGS